MARDGGEVIPAIFNPRKIRAPSVVVTGDSPNGPFGGFTPHPIPNVQQFNAQHHPPPITHSDSVASSQPDGGENLNIQLRCDTPTPITIIQPPQTQSRSRFKRCKDSCCSEKAQKMYFGICVTILVTVSWVGSAHSVKYLYLTKPEAKFTSLPPEATILVSVDSEDNDNTTKLVHTFSPTESSFADTFSAPFFASWFFTNFTILFFPIYLLGRFTVKKCDGAGEVIGDIIRGFRDRGFTVGRFLNRCLSFCILWVIMTYILMLSLKTLLATDVLALFATNVASVYLLSWVILHEQFVGVRIVAVILCDTGIALLAYVDGITNSPTLSGVVMAALSAAGYAVFKVMFRKVMGDPPVGQIAFAFTTIGILNATVLWPICLGLYFSGSENMPWDPVPWVVLLIASILLLVFHILMQFSSAVTYNMFVTLGLITSVPVSAALDILLYDAQFYGMKLSGLILITVGFFLVMLPDNWPDYITRLLRITGRAFLRSQCCCDYGDLNYEDSKYYLVGPQCTMGIPSSKRNSWSLGRRLSDGIHSLSPKIAERPCEMIESQPYISLDAQQFNLNLTKPKPNYVGNDRSRHSFSVAETKLLSVGFNPSDDNRESFVSFE